MSKARATIKIDAPADRVWQLIGGFNALPDWHPAVEKSHVQQQGTTSVRTLTLSGGGTIVERLEQIDEVGRCYTYSIVSGPLPVADYVATISVRNDADGNTSVVEWSSKFQPAGVSERDAVEAVEKIYTLGFQNLKRMLGA